MPKSRKPVSQKGFTLIEIAIVMVIIGLLLGGVLKGQEMIKNAKAHNVSNQVNAVKAAVIAFQDRYRALPGDYLRASTNIPGLLSTENGNGNSRVLTNVTGTPNDEVAYAWHHLGASGFLVGTFDGLQTGITALTTWDCSPATCPQNAYGGSMFFIYENEQGSYQSGPDAANSNQLWIGRGLPVEMVAEVDRKLDDGQPGSGTLQIGDAFSGAGGAVVAAGGTRCEDAGQWDVAGQSPDCGAVALF